MTARIFAIIAAMVLALGAATALAQPTAKALVPFQQASFIDHGKPPRLFERVGAKVTRAAFVSDGCDPSYLRVQKELLNEPGYSIGTGAAALCHAPATVGDGSDSSYLWNQQEVLREPGYSVGTGVAWVGRA